MRCPTAQPMTSTTDASMVGGEAAAEKAGRRRGCIQKARMAPSKPTPCRWPARPDRTDPPGRSGSTAVRVMRSGVRVRSGFARSNPDRLSACFGIPSWRFWYWGPGGPGYFSGMHKEYHQDDGKKRIVYTASRKRTRTARTARTPPWRQEGRAAGGLTLGKAEMPYNAGFGAARQAAFYLQSGRGRLARMERLTVRLA